MKNRASLPDNVLRGRSGGKLRTTDARQRFAFTAVITEDGAVVVRVVEEISTIWPQEEYGCFETWTRAQEFATLLNESYGINPIEAQHIVISSSLARSKEESC